MCGLVAIASGHAALDPKFELAIPAMTDSLSHRGPDSGAIRCLPGAVLGHRRLSVIGVLTGAQPMPNEDETIWVVFNGEIYNHKSVRAELEARGHRFRTNADTEVIVHGYEEWGTSCVERFAGMFAFVVQDTRTSTTFAARDRLGKKPLFYTVLGSHLHLASELKALKCSPDWVGEVDEEAIEAYLTLGYVPAPRTAYRNVHKLCPAHWLLFDRHGVREQRYWDVPAFDQDQRDEDHVLDDLDGAVRDSVLCRLESEVPLGAFLSGGIDSGLVVSYMTQGAVQRPLTLTVGFSEDPKNELAAAAATAEALNTAHHAHLVQVDPAPMLDTLTHAFDEPFADASAIPTYYVCGAAREHVTVALSGDGGDETFAGYDFRYLPHVREERMRRLGAPLQLAARGMKAVWPRSRRLPRPLRLFNTFANLAGSQAEAFYRDLCLLKPEERDGFRLAPARNHYRETWAYALVQDAYTRCPSTDALQRAQYADLTVYMPNDPLVKVDRMSMQHGLEVRSPFLDHRVVEFAFRVPTRTKFRTERSKYLLRRLAERRLPPRIVNLPKRGFEAPIAAWFRGASGQVFAEDVLRPGTFVTSRLSQPRIQACLDAHRAGRADWSYALWSIWMLHRWAEADTASRSLRG